MDFWYIEAHYVKDGEKVVYIDRRGKQWGPATRPTKYDGLGDINDAAEALDERLYFLDDRDYVLAWRTSVLNEYYLCDYLLDAEAVAWFQRQAMRIGIYTDDGKYLSSFEPGKVCCLWKGRGWHSSGAGGVDHAYAAYRLPDDTYIWCDTIKCESGGFTTKGYAVSAVDAVERVQGLNEAPSDEMLLDADRLKAGNESVKANDRAMPKQSTFIVVLDEATNEELLLDVSAEHWGPINDGRDSDGVDCYWNLMDAETLYRQGTRFALLTESVNVESGLLAEATSCVLTNQEAADWLIRNGFEPPADLAGLATIRAVADVPDEEIGAARQREAARAQLTPDEEQELELLFPTVNTMPANDAPPEAAVVAGNGVAAVAKPEGKVAVEAATAGVTTAIEIKHASAQDDGPMPPRSFILGDRHAELTTSQFRLVDFLWQQERCTATKRNVSMTVWGDEEAQSTRLPSLISRTNERLLENGVRMTVEPNGDYVRLLIDRP